MIFGEKIPLKVIQNSIRNEIVYIIYTIIRNQKKNFIYTAISFLKVKKKFLELKLIERTWLSHGNQS